jgi:hypothetical protein
MDLSHARRDIVMEWNMKTGKCAGDLTTQAENMGMNHDEDVTYCEELGVDSDLVPFLAKEGISLLALKCVQYWRRGYGGADIGRFGGISTEEAEANISHVQKVIPGEMLARDTELRNEIIESESRFEKTRQKLHESLTRSVDSYLETGQDPTAAMREFRKYISEEPDEGDSHIGGDGNRDISLDKKSQPMPPLQGEETNADIQYIKALLQDEPAATNIRERDGASGKKPQIAPETPLYGFSISAETLLGLRRQKPVAMQMPCREALECVAPSSLISDLRERDGNICRDGEKSAIAEEPGQIKSLRKQTNQVSIEGSADDHNPEAANELIAELRGRDKKSAKTANMEEHVRQNPTAMASTGINIQSNPCNRPDRVQSQSSSIPAGSGNKGSPRITFRASSELRNRLEETAKRLGIGLSDIVRELLERGLESGSDTDAKATAASLAIIPEAFEYSAPYRAWCGDLRLEFKKRFLSVVALGHETAQRWPKTAWVRLLFLGLLPLQKYLEDGSVRHD